ncbi:MAG: hypothetical protein KH322_05300 [Peptoniphilaceae bacterium]|nr:hypothetical protein [Peptoniphilaceae bacterium]
MKKKFFLAGIILFAVLLILVETNPNKRVRMKEVRQFTETMCRSDEHIKDLKFYFRRPTLRAEMVYEGPLEKEKLISITEDFKALVDVEFMQKIGDKYWGGARPSDFELYIYCDKDKEGNNYDYLIYSQYNKTYKVDENPDNIDGYKTWTISGAENEGVLYKD